MSGISGGMRLGSSHVDVNINSTTPEEQLVWRMSGTEQCKVEGFWQRLREGEVSPYKLLVALFMREVFMAEHHSHASSVELQTLLLLYKLISSLDKPTYSSLKLLLDDPEHKVKPEVLKKFHRIVSSMEAGDSYFLYELTSFMSGNQNQIIMKKRITSSSVFGKFLRTIYVNVRRMSYAQIHYLHAQLYAYVKESGGLKPSKRHSADVNAKKASFKALEIFSKYHDSCKKSGRFGINAFSGYLHSRRLVYGGGDADEQREFHKRETLKAALAATAKERVEELKAIWDVPTNTAAAQEKEDSVTTVKKPSLRSSSLRKTYLSSPRSIPSKSPRKSRGSSGTTPVGSPTKPLGAIQLLYEGEDGYYISDKDNGETSTSGQSWKSATAKSPRSPRVGRRKLSSYVLLSPLTEAEVRSRRRLDPLTAPEHKEASAQDPLEKNVLKFWSRRQIELCIRSLAKQLYFANAHPPSPLAVTRFVNAVLNNPSSNGLLPQLYFLEYLNSLRVKDVSRCTDCLRTSFDARFPKANLMESSKGTPYAAYNFALLYNQLGYKADALSSLEEAFKAAHAVADSICLHHCHNLWCNFHGRAYTEAIVTVTKEVDNNMAYLHSLNVFANAFDIHGSHVSPDEVLYMLWHYNADCDLEEMEAMLLTSITSFFTVFGWHELVSFPCQIILNAPWRWGARWYATALCNLANNLLYEGDLMIATELMSYGAEIFQLDCSPAGELFTLQQALFKATVKFLAYELVPTETMATIEAFSKNECTYWRAYNAMITSHWAEASKLLLGLTKQLQQASTESKLEVDSLKLRTLLLHGEVNCLDGNCSGALNHITKALDIATAISSDIYITLCLINIASIQCHLGLINLAGETMKSNLRSITKSCSPWLNSRLNVVNAKLAVSLWLSKQQPFDKLSANLNGLDKSLQFYRKLGNSYRQLEILHLKLKFSSSSQRSALEREVSQLSSLLPYSDSTCLV